MYNFFDRLFARYIDDIRRMMIESGYHFQVVYTISKFVFTILFYDLWRIDIR